MKLFLSNINFAGINKIDDGLQIIIGDVFEDDDGVLARINAEQFLEHALRNKYILWRRRWGVGKD